MGHNNMVTSHSIFTGYFHGLMGNQRAPGFLGLIAWYPEHRYAIT